jgi:hypothetical protein
MIRMVWVRTPWLRRHWLGDRVRWRRRSDLLVRSLVELRVFHGDTCVKGSTEIGIWEVLSRTSEIGVDVLGNGGQC